MPAVLTRGLPAFQALKSCERSLFRRLDEPKTLLLRGSHYPPKPRLSGQPLRAGGLALCFLAGPPISQRYGDHLASPATGSGITGCHAYSRAAGDRLRPRLLLVPPGRRFPGLDRTGSGSLARTTPARPEIGAPIQPEQLPFPVGRRSRAGESRRLGGSGICLAAIYRAGSGSASDCARGNAPRAAARRTLFSRRTAVALAGGDPAQAALAPRPLAAPPERSTRWLPRAALADRTRDRAF